MNPRHQITIIIEDTASAINPTDLAEFLFLFRGTAVALSNIYSETQQQAVKLPRQYELEKIRRHLTSLSPKALDGLFDTDKKINLLQIERIDRNSPMVLVMVGCAFLLTTAVILSGGKVQISPTSLSATLPPLGKGIQILREALGLNKQLKTRYGLREVTIKLTKSEYDDLMIPINGQGGFQTFFRSLQSRVNKQTRKLTSSQADLERIYRYESEAQKGGWQGRVLKIFGKHFPPDRS